MRRKDKRQLLAYLQEMTKIQRQLGDPALAASDQLEILQQLQSAGYEAGTAIEASEGEGTKTVAMLEDYCEMLYQCSEKAGAVWASRDKDLKALDQQMRCIQESLSQDIPTKTEAVFLVSKASYWKNLELLWCAAAQDPNCHAVVIKEPMQQEREEKQVLPSDVPITDLEEVDIKSVKPDFIFIDTPYDRDDKGPLPDLYSDQLMQLTDCLVLGTEQFDVSNEIEKEQLFGYFRTTGVFNADRILVWSEQIRELSIKSLTELTGDETQKYWQGKIYVQNRDRWKELNDY